ncbi:MAG: response regulator [Chroococcidiopsidaceae cyanobacterium CP_BM_ER_R8_30]|nr:response regulator [Chroococcidiopsidaceae cyanobacterium CP_BM_ER_R8_30]
MSDANILVVEDEIIVAKDIQNRLTRLGYTVLGVVDNGEEAIRQAKKFRPDLVLMDIKLKGEMDGIEAAKLIYTCFHIPVIYLTANADKITIERARKAEPFGYIIKPFKERELSITIEITLSKHQLERKLQESEKWLTTVLRSIGDAVITSDHQGTITFINPLAEALMGWKQEDVLGKMATEVFQTADERSHVPLESPILQALHQGTTIHLLEPALLIARDGKKIPIDDSAAPIKDDQGNITGAVLIFRDVTERRQAQEALRKQTEQMQLLEELERLNQLKDEFLSTVSHELRTPLSNMRMAIQMLKNAPNSGRGQRYLEILQAECDREIELINDFLDLQRLEAASSQFLCAESVSLQDMLPSLIEPFRTRTQERQQNLTINLPPELPPIISDRASLERMLAELLNNACKYTPAGGEIILNVLYKSSMPISLLADSTPKTIFTISNQAEIPAAELPRIFEKFYRVPKADPWKQGGTGLGLALVQKLVEQLQGDIQVESCHGWTTFTICLTPLTTNVGQQACFH